MVGLEILSRKGLPKSEKRSSSGQKPGGCWISDFGSRATREIVNTYAYDTVRVKDWGGCRENALGFPGSNFKQKQTVGWRPVEEGTWKPEP